MKKITVLCILFTALALSAYAQLNVGAYAKSIWTPIRVRVADNGDTSYTTAVQVPWGETDISAGVNVDGWTQWGGLHLGVEVANGAINKSANAYSAKGDGWIWIKPFDFIPHMETFTIWLGNPVYEKLMGQIGGSNLANYVLNRSYYINSEDDARQRQFRLEIQDPQFNIFTRIDPYSWGNANQPYQNLWWPRVASAAMVTWEPVKNLSVVAFVAPEFFNLLDWNKDSAGVNNPILESINGAQLRDDDINQDFYNAADVYRKMQVAAGYDIPGFGFARVQWIGVRNVFEFAFQLKAMGDVMLDMGFKVPYEGTKKDTTNSFLTSTYKKKRDYQASIAATYRNYNFRFMGRIDTAFLGSDSSGSVIKTRGLDLIAYLVPSYIISVGTVGMDLGFEYEQKDDFNGWNQDSMQAGAGLWFARNMGNANFKIALVSRFPLKWEEIKQPFEIMIPIVLDIGF